MQGGKLDQKIYFERLVQSYDRGEVKEEFQPVDVTTDSPPETLYTPAYVQTARGTEAFSAAHIQAKKTIRVQIRYRDDVTSDWRFTWNGKTYYITDVDDVYRRKGELWLTAELKDGA